MMQKLSIAFCVLKDKEFQLYMLKISLTIWFNAKKNPHARTLSKEKFYGYPR